MVGRVLASPVLGRVVNVRVQEQPTPARCQISVSCRCEDTKRVFVAYPEVLEIAT